MDVRTHPHPHPMLPTVAELMTADPLIVPAHLPASEAAALLEFYRVSGAPVVDEDGAVLGVVSRSDLVHTFTSEALMETWPEIAVRDVMSGPAITVGCGALADEATRLMETHRVHRLVVVGADRRTPIGIVTRSDLLRALARWDDR